MNKNVMAYHLVVVLMFTITTCLLGNQDLKNIHMLALQYVVCFLPAIADFSYIRLC